jgi:hypothetical protein
LAIAIAVAITGMVVAGVNRAGGTTAILTTNAAGGDTKSGVVSSSGSANAAGMSATVSVAGNISIAAIVIVAGIIMTVVGLTIAVQTITDTIAINKNARQNRALLFID